jgi:hypothetical protein
MVLLVTSASGINGNGYGALLAFKRDGTLIGPFNDDNRIVDPGDLSWIKREGCCFSTAAVIGYWRSVQTGLSFATRARSQD